jgi:chromosome segregation ATPase
MSQITNALRKLQTQRESFVPSISATEEDRFRPLLNFLPAIGVAIAIALGLAALVKLEVNKNEVVDLNSVLAEQRQDIKSLRKEIKILNATLGETRKASETQMQEFNSHLSQASKNLEIKMYTLGISTNNHYDKIQDYLLSNKQEMSALSKEIRTMNKKVEEISPANLNKDIKNP